MQFQVAIFALVIDDEFTKDVSCFAFVESEEGSAVVSIDDQNNIIMTGCLGAYVGAYLWGEKIIEVDT